MDKASIKALLNDYENNCCLVNELSLNTVSNVQLPVCSSLSTLSKSCFKHILYNMHKLNHLSSHEKVLFCTLITDALTTVIKYKEFFDSFDNDNTHIFELLLSKIQLIISKINYEELDVIKQDIAQMIKYAERIDSSVFNSESLSKLTLNCKKNVFSVPKKPNQTTNLNNNIQTCMCCIENVVKSINNTSKCCVSNNNNNKPSSPSKVLQSLENVQNINKAKLSTKETPPVQKKDAFQVPTKVKRNAFDILMQSAKKRK